MASPKSSELAAALAEIAARGLGRVALVVPFVLEAADIEAIIAAPAICWVGQHGDVAALPAGFPTLVQDDGAGVPDGVLHILFVGPWRSLPMPLARAARRLRVTTLLCRVGDRWRHPPTPRHLVKAVYYKALDPVVGPPGRAVGRAFDTLVWRPVTGFGRNLRGATGDAARRLGRELHRLSSSVARELAAERGRLSIASFGRLPRVLGMGLGYALQRARRRLGRRLPDPAVALRRKALRLARKAAPGLVLAPSFRIAPDEIAALLAVPGIAGLVLMHGPDLDTAQDPRLGAWLGNAWILPKAAKRVYVIGSWRVLGRRAIASAVDRRLDRVALPLGPLWLPIPLGSLRLFLALRRALPDPRLTTRRFRRVLAGTAVGTDFVHGRVVVVCGSLAPGGAERQVANTLAGLQRSGLESVQLLCDYLAPNQPSNYDFYLPLVRRAGVPAREITVRMSRVDPAAPELPESFRQAARHLPANLAADIANLYLEFRALRPEVVHAFLDWSSVRAGMAAVLAGVPRIVLSGRNVNPSHFALYQRYMDPIYSALAERPEVNLVNNSEAGARDYEAWLRLHHGRIGVLRNGVDFGGPARATPERIRAIRAALGVPETAPLIGGVFRLFPEKRPMLWVDAAAEILRRQPAAHFVIYGQGVLEDELRRHIHARGLEGRLVLAGVTEDVLAALSALDIFMLTSFKEGTPNVVLEAQWVGTPVVAVEAGGTREALDEGRTGWIVDPPTPTGLADRVSALLDDPAALTECRSAGPSFVEARFGIGRMVEETLAVYGFDGRVASNRRAGAA